MKVDGKQYPIVQISHKFDNVDRKVMILPVKDVWQEPVVKLGDGVIRKMIDKWLKAGVLDNGQLVYPTRNGERSHRFSVTFICTMSWMNGSSGR